MKEKEPGKKEEKVTFPSQLKKRVSKEKKEKTSNSFLYLGYFVVIVFLCILVAFTLRMIFLYKKSTFNTSSYVVLVKNKSPYIVSYNKMLNKISYINLEDFKEGNKIKQSLSYSFPLDGELETTAEVNPENFSSFFSLTSFLLSQFNSKFTGLTILDVSNLIISSRSVPRNAIFSKSVKTAKDGTLEGMPTDEIYDVFKDLDIIDEALSVEVINATDVEGLAGNVSQVLKNAGCNVITVTSSDPKNKSQLIAAGKSKTIERLSHILGIQYEIVKSLHSSADIRIVIGEDLVKSAKLTQE